MKLICNDRHVSKNTYMQVERRQESQVYKLATALFAS